MTSSGRIPADVADELLSAYLLATGSTNSAAVRNPTKKLRAAVLEVAAELVSAGRSPAGYVEYVVTRFAKRNAGKLPFVWQVFGPVALEGWLPEYASEARQVLPTPSYSASDERRAEYYAPYRKSEIVVEKVWTRFYPHEPFKRFVDPAPLAERPALRDRDFDDEE